MDRRGFLKRTVGAGITAAIAPIIPRDSDLIRLECKGCRGPLKPVGDFFECESCGARYALGGVVMQEEEDEEPERVMEGLHCLCDSTGEPIWTSCATPYGTGDIQAVQEAQLALARAARLEFEKEIGL